MVYYFNAVEAPQDDFGLGESISRVVYMGKDKHENVPLIEHSHPKNLWFHVDNYSSAHIYLQLTPDEQLVPFEKLEVPEAILMAMAQLTKANSIKANKVNNITIIYTPVDNLHTDGSMDDGTVTFKNPKKVRKVFVAKKENSIVNKLNKTKTEKSTDEFINEQREYIATYMREKREREREQEQQERELAKLYQDQKQRNKDPYADLFTEDAVRMSNSAYRNEDMEDDFM
ncbi:hypothetical protein CAAN1_24S00188 [[Candida] anglica]|uniref:NFACT RNA-binding domain-containing protein n=1 Tax=[Candida] anglica TaxID=148631 RepID=A0ABP0EDS9_9ASCO